MITLRKNELVYLLRKACRFGAKRDFTMDIILPTSATQYHLGIAFITQNERDMGLTAMDRSPLD